MHTFRRWALALALLLMACAAGETNRCEFDLNVREWLTYADRLNKANAYHYGRWVPTHLIQTTNREFAKTVERNKVGVINSWWSCQRYRDELSQEDVDFLDDSCSNDAAYIFRHDPEISQVGWYLLPPDVATNQDGNKMEKYRHARIFQAWAITPWEHNVGGSRFTGHYAGVLRTMYSKNFKPFADCKINPSSIAFLNGVSTPYLSAQNTLWKIKSEFGENYNSTPLQYDLLHNQTSCDGKIGASCLGDLAEVFEQRQQELNTSLKNRWEIFWDTLAGRHESPASSTGALRASVGGSLINFLIALDTALKNKVVDLISSAFKKPLLNRDFSNHLEKLRANARKEISTTIIAHSQGNLFASAINTAYGAMQNTFQDRPNPPIFFVHVAPPTSTLNGEYILADKDLVINSLEVLMPGSAPAANVQMPISSDDKLSHGFVETYWDKTRPAFSKLRKLVTETLDQH